MRSILWVMCLAACGNKAEQPAPQPTTPTPTAPTPVVAPACETTLADAAKRIATESKRVALDTTAERIRLTMTASCEAEAWPANVITCIDAARLDVDLASCTEQLPHEQYQRLQKKIAQLVPPTPPVAVTPPTAAVAVAAPRPPRPVQNDDLIAPGALKKLDCSKSIVSARDSACIKQYCAAHATDARCMID